MQSLRYAIRNDLGKEDVQWCLTVPAIWDEKAKQLMRTYAEKAGMIQGPHCPAGVSASRRGLSTILEPEAASVHCLESVYESLNLTIGDKVIVADVGGGTIDLVVHEIVEFRPPMGVTRVKEAVPSFGSSGGGTFVDIAFLQWVQQKVGCYEVFIRQGNTELSLRLFSWWQRVKADFDRSPTYTAQFMLRHSGLSEAWKNYDRAHHIHKEDKAYWVLTLNADDLRQIFHSEVSKVISLIEPYINMAKVLMVVGGMAESQYVKHAIISKFKNSGRQIIIPHDPGRAVCRGAVKLHMSKDYIQSRISKKTYGICAIRDAQKGDPENLIFINDEGRRKCRSAFSAFVQVGERICFGQETSRCFYSHTAAQLSLEFDVYSSPRRDPKYTIEADATREGSFDIDISCALHLGKRREVKVTMVFGDSLINVIAVPTNFVAPDNRKELTVRFEAS
ncbi:hypothetical protein KP509_1Z185200 [Ceratopteris richardii]|nr:hypothetical protein KP509_1Z185200 [Ceratopteris richardii]